MTRKSAGRECMMRESVKGSSVRAHQVMQRIVVYLEKLTRLASWSHGPYSALFRRSATFITRTVSSISIRCPCMHALMEGKGGANGKTLENNPACPFARSLHCSPF